MARFNADGSTDTSFSGDGRASFGSADVDQISAITLQNKKILVAGGVNGSSVSISRFNLNGTLDASFHLNGRLGIDFKKQGIETATGVYIVDNAKIVLAGSAFGNFVLARIDASSRPNSVHLNHTSLFANQPAGTVVGSLSTVDNDAGDTFAYSLVAGDGATNNGGFKIVGNQLQAKHPFPVGTYSVRIRSTDSFGNFRDLATTVTVTAASDPVIGGIATVGYTRNSGSILLATSAMLADSDSPNFAGGTLTVSITGGANASNRLLLGGSFSVDQDHNLLRSGVIIGTQTSDGVGTDDLSFTFNSAAKPPMIQQLLRALRFRTVGSDQRRDANTFLFPHRRRRRRRERSGDADRECFVAECQMYKTYFNICHLTSHI